MRLLIPAIGALLLMGSGVALAAPAEADSADVKEKNQEGFHGLNLGAGLSLTLDTGSHDRVNDAEVVAGVVRVKEEENARARIMLESHYFFFPNYGFPGVKEDGSFLGVQHKDWGIGPFVAVQGGEEEIVQAVALGLMIGFRRPESDDGWNIGLGVVYDPKTKTLGDGLRPNEPLPAGETEIRYKSRSQKGVVILTSFSF